MRKIYFTAVSLCICQLALSQIPNLPDISRPQTSGLGNYSSNNYGSETVGRNLQRSPVPIKSNRSLSIQPNDYEARSRSQNNAIMQDIERDIAEVRQAEFRRWVENGRNMPFDLPSLSGKSGTQAYYDAYNKLTAMDSDNYSLTDVNFTVENAFYDNKQDLKGFKSGIQKTAKQLLLKMKERKQDTESNVSKNLILFEYFSKDMNLGGTTHKAFEYDFKDYMGEKDHSKMFVSKLLKTGSGQCHSLPQYYLMLAEAMGAEAYLSLAPNHSYVRFMDDEMQYRNIELTNGMFSTDTSLLESGYIKSEALQSKIYMDNLTKKELLGMAYFDLARGYVRKFGYDEFVNKVIDKALELYPNGIAPNMEKANVEQVRLLSGLKRLGINPDDKRDIERAGYFPRANELFQQLQEQDKKINELGYTEMPAYAYESWLAGLKTEKNKQESEALLQKIHLYQLQKQKERQEQEAVKKAQEKKKQDTKPKYIPIDPNKL
ncbi:hypothetical protein CRN76_20695 [Chryseobacterium indologenes]|uniref:hypothetical protein n=1 Tax=Chryseobacterium indologenes TaxID=253 RepID=UPI000BFE0681|nr:hypothetical protein [Chryseobacterium indologenes]ATN07643.1 hypothetical protein CRN76_20695 [Chryseobacterium indologenes]AYY83618.1 hypothetical protein EGX91_03135 [Chryseobacterium indologenes]QIX80540.1 hypothetical protein FOB56_04540 [Chryseobacterium indologenes]